MISRRSFLAGTAAAGALATLPFSARAQLVPGMPQIVFDPALFGKAVEEMYLWYQRNKLTITQLVFIFREYELAREDHVFSDNINNVWSFIGPQIYEAEAAALQNHKITNDAFKLFQIAYDSAPGLWNGDFQQVEFGFEQYLQYEYNVNTLASNAIKANLKSAAKIAAASKQDAKSAMTATTRTKQYQHTYAQLIGINNGIGLLNSTISTGVQTMLQNAVAAADFEQKKHQASTNAAKSFLAGLLGVNYTPSTSSPGGASPNPSPGASSSPGPGASPSPGPAASGTAHADAVLRARADALSQHLSAQIRSTGTLQDYLSGRRSLPPPSASLP